MKIGFFSQEFGLPEGPHGTSSLSLEEVISKGAELGFDGVELECTTARLSPLSDKAYVKKIKELIESKGLEITDLAPHPDFLFPGIRAMEKELIALKANMELAVALDAKLVRIHIVSTVTYGPLPEGFTAFGRPIPLINQYLRGVEGVKRATKIAEDVGVSLGLDNHYFLTVLEQLKIVKDINSLNLKMFIDAGNCVLHGEDLIESARACGDLLVHSHAKDCEILGSTRLGGYGQGMWSRYVSVGEGVVDWEGYLKVLKEIGYKGFLSLETHTRTPYPDWETAENGLKYLGR